MTFTAHPLRRCLQFVCNVPEQVVRRRERMTDKAEAGYDIANNTADYLAAHVPD